MIRRIVGFGSELCQNETFPCQLCGGQGKSFPIVHVDTRIGSEALGDRPILLTGIEAEGQKGD